MSWMGRKPNGDYTKSKKAYIRAWRELSQPLEDAFGLKCLEFDPDLRFFGQGPGGQPVGLTLPVWFAEKLRDRILE